MRNRPPLRFLALVVGGWIVARAAWLIPPPPPGVPQVLALALPEPAERRATGIAYPPTAMTANLSAAIMVSPVRRVAATPAAIPPALPPGVDEGPAIAGELLLYAVAAGRLRSTRAPPLLAADPVPDAPDAPSGPRRLHGYAYLYARPGGGGATLGPGGQLGASQAGVRIVYPLTRHVAAAARVSTALREPTASEAAVGLDVVASGRSNVRLSLERRIALGEGGRDAWAAYAAGGFYEGLGGGFELDGYAQAGIVGLRRRDLFADGALRAGGRLPLDAERALVLGGGAWAAAQPGAARLDLGPRAALVLPLSDATATLALEGRMRVAGHARPGSGVALTLATDF